MLLHVACRLPLSLFAAGLRRRPRTSRVWLSSSVEGPEREDVPRRTLGELKRTSVLPEEDFEKKKGVSFGVSGTSLGEELPKQNFNSSLTAQELQFFERAPSDCRGTLSSLDDSIEAFFKLESNPDKKWLFRTFYKGAVSRDFSIPKDSPPSKHPTLMERETQIREIAFVWSRADKAREQELKHRQRHDFKIPVCVGMPGLGKTRLSQEYPRILERAGLTARKTAGICVRYFNGQSILPADSTLDIDVSFAARMLHSAFELDEQSGLPLQTFLEHVQATPSLQKELSIIDVLRVYRAALIDQGFITKEEDLQVVLAIDDYHSLDDDHVKNLLDLLLNAYMTLDSFGIHLFPVLASMEWNKITDFGPCSPILRKIPLSFISVMSARNIALEIYSDGKHNASFLRHLVPLSDIPRQVVEYADDVSKHFESVRKNSF